MRVTNMIVGGLRTTFPKMKSKEKIYKDWTTTSVSDTCQHIFKSKASTQQPIPLKMNAFNLTKNGEPWPNESGGAGDMEEKIQVANICSIILDESLSATQQVLTLFKDVSHHSIIEHVKISGLIVQNKEIKMALFNQTNTKEIIDK